jgi:TRAP-type C4-dicarboxylate transport system substrate-binding protein
MNAIITCKTVMRFLRLIGIIAALGFCAQAYAAKPLIIKVATVTPKGSIYHRVLQDIGEKWRKAQGDNARFIIYTDGSQGTESETVRRLRIGQLQASLLTVSGLMEIVPSVTALQFMPSTFRNWREVDYVLENIRGDMEKEFEDRGYKVLLWGMGGWVQFFSTKPRMLPEDYKDAKIFAWAGTKDQQAMMISLGFNPVVLDLPDLLPALQTGMVDVVPVAPMWALTGQFYRYAPHMLKMNWVPIVGATVLSMKTWNAMRPEARAAMTEAAAEAEEELRSYREELDGNAIRAMEERGLTVYEATADAEKTWTDLVESVWPMIRGTMVPRDTFDRVHQLLAQYRATQQ